MWLSSTVGNMAAMDATACSSLLTPAWLNVSTSKMSAWADLIKLVLIVILELCKLTDEKRSKQ